MSSGAVSAGTAAEICGCSLDALEGYRVRAMPLDRRRDLSPDHFRPEEVIAVFLAVGLEPIRKQLDIDRFVAELLGAFPAGEDWVVEASARRPLRVLSRSEAKLDGRRSARWMSPRSAFALVREQSASD